MATDIAGDTEATMEVIYQQALATAEARQTLLDEAKNWPLGLYETFDDNERDWAEGEGDDPRYANIQWTLEGGKYQWNVKAYDGFVWWVIPSMEKVADFYLATTAQQMNNPEYGEYGVIFRRTEDGDYYLFEVNEQGNFAVYIYYVETWERLIDWQFTPELNVGGENHLAVLARGEEFSFFINDRFVGEIKDDRLEIGEAGILIGLSNPEEEAIWNFDGFELRAP